MTDHITTLRALNGAIATKRFHGTTSDGYGRARWFSAESTPVKNINDVFCLLENLATRRDVFVVRGQPIVGTDLSRCLRRAHGRKGEPATFASQPRRWVCLDFDGIDSALDIVQDLASVGEHLRRLLPPPFHDVACVVRASASAGIKAGLRAHLWFYTSAPVSDKDWKAILQAAPVDTALFNSVQPHYTASPLFEGVRDPYEEHSRTLRLPGREHVDVEALLAQTREAPEPSRARAIGRGRIPAGERNNSLYSLALSCRARGFEEPEVFNAVRGANESRTEQPLPVQELVGIVTSASLRERGFPLTDSGNAERVAAMFGHELRYVVEWNDWIAYDGKRWTRLHGIALAHFAAKLTARAIFAEAIGTSDDRYREALSRHARKSESRQARNAMVELASRETSLHISCSELDAHPNLFCCANGTVDLNTGSLSNHNAADFITKITHVPFVSGARCVRFDQLLDHLFPVPAVRDYMQRAAGCAVAGSAREDVIFLLVGAPRCGKTTLARAFIEALGEYCASASMRSFCHTRGGGPNPARSDIARLVGKRVVIASEIHPGMEFDGGLLKKIAGGEPLSVRANYENEYEARTSFTLFLIANDGDLPRVRAEDDALWERVKQIPVGSMLAEEARDSSFRDSFANEDAKVAVLAWLVDAAVQYSQHGLCAAPEHVGRATEALREAMDPALPFIDECLAFEEQGRALKRDVRTYYVSWCQLHGELPLGHKRFAAALRAAGRRAGVEVTDTTRRLSHGHPEPAWGGVSVRSGVLEHYQATNTRRW